MHRLNVNPGLASCDTGQSIYRDTRKKTIFYKRILRDAPKQLYNIRSHPMHFNANGYATMLFQMRYYACAAAVIIMDSSDICHNVDRHMLSIIVQIAYKVV